MILSILGIIIILGYIIFFRGYDIEETLIGCVGIFIIYFGMMLCISGFINAPYEVTATYELKQYDILGLENKKTEKFEASGRFVLGCGSFNAKTETEMNYYYFKNCEYGAMLETSPMAETYVREKDDITPSLIWIMEERLYKGHPKLAKWFPFVEAEDRKEAIKQANILEVPVNTIKIEYNVDV